MGSVTIPAGQTYGFYIVSTAGGTLNNGINYILNVPTGSVQTENADLQVLGGKGVPNRVDQWGKDYDHNWPTWREMLPKYLSQVA